MYGDEKYKALTRNAQLLWRVILCDMRENSMPGLYATGVYGITDRMVSEGDHWHTKEIEVALQELEEKGMLKIDHGATVIFLPNALKQGVNRPINPKHMMGWKLYFDKVPESPLCQEWLEQLEHYAGVWGENYLTAFHKAWGGEPKKAKPKRREKKAKEKFNLPDAPKELQEEIERWVGQRPEPLGQLSDVVTAIMAEHGAEITPDEFLHHANKALRG
jgi:hypothetical protein